MRTGETIQEGQVIPEAEVVRDNPEAAVPFQVREAATVRLGPRGRRGDQGLAEPGQSFNVREAVTVTVPPPHWAQLTQQEEADHVPYPGPDTDSGKTGSK